MEGQGIGPAGLATLLAIWSIGALTLEIPSGVLGDLLPRKQVMMWGAGLHSVAFVIWWLAPGFWGYALGFTVWAIASSLDSGTADAYLFEILEDKDDFELIYGRSETAATLGAGLALLLGGWVATHGYDLSLWLSALVPLLCLALLTWGLPNLEHKAAYFSIRSERLMHY